MTTPGRAKLDRIIKGLDDALQIVKAAPSATARPGAIEALHEAINRFTDERDRIHGKGGKPPALWQVLVAKALVKRPTWTEDDIWEMVDGGREFFEEAEAVARATGLRRSALPPKAKKYVVRYIRSLVGNKRRA